MSDIAKILTETRSALEPIFERIAIAEGQISAAKERDPANAERYDASFMLLVPTDTILSDRLYTHHCREILGRVAVGEDTRPGTNAEVLGALSMATNIAPPGRTLSLAYARLFEEIMPEHGELADTLTDSVGKEHYPGDVDELIETTRRKLSVADRVRR